MLGGASVRFDLGNGDDVDVAVVPTLLPAHHVPLEHDHPCREHPCLNQRVGAEDRAWGKVVTLSRRGCVFAERRDVFLHVLQCRCGHHLGIPIRIRFGHSGCRFRSADQGLGCRASSAPCTAVEGVIGIRIRVRFMVRATHRGGWLVVDRNDQNVIRHDRPFVQRHVGMLRDGRQQVEVRIGVREAKPTVADRTPHELVLGGTALSRREGALLTLSFGDLDGASGDVRTVHP